MERLHASSAARRSKGFTLVELLVVIAIILVLASLIFVGSHRALQASREAVAVGNVKQIGNGILGLLGDGSPLAENKPKPGAFPSPGGYTRSGVHYCWVYEVAEAAGLGEFDKGTWGANFVWFQDPNETFFHDPTADWDIIGSGGSITRSDKSLWATSHYGYNGRLGTFAEFVPKPPKNPNDRDHSLGEILAPEETILVGQAAGARGISRKEKSRDGYVQTDGSLLIFPWRRQGSVASRVKGGGYCMFVDGHVSLVKQEKVHSQSSPFRRRTFNPIGDQRGELD